MPSRPRRRLLHALRGSFEGPLYTIRPRPPPRLDGPDGGGLQRVVAGGEPDGALAGGLAALDQRGAEELLAVREAVLHRVHDQLAELRLGEAQRVVVALAIDGV